METIFSFADDLGFAKVVHIYDPATGLKAIVSIDNTTRGPAFGGIRMAEDVTALEVMRLSRAMTFKNAAADIPYGGGKSAIIADPKLPLGEKEKLMRRPFARAFQFQNSLLFKSWAKTANMKSNKIGQTNLGFCMIHQAKKRNKNNRI
jgi:glutamate dehydrogenase (NAD(P)+)/glutamate dehydrogenase (NADP+)